MRSHTYTDDVKTAIGETYPFSYAASMSFDHFNLSIEKF